MEASVSGSAPAAPRAMLCSLTIKPMLRLVVRVGIPVTVVVCSQGNLLFFKQRLKCGLVMCVYGTGMALLVLDNMN
jgi:hypothetical protein